MPITWTPENNHKILLHLVKRIETKDIEVDKLAALFEGATPKALREQIAKLRRESKLIDDGPENPILPSDTTAPNLSPTTTALDANNSSPLKASPAATGKASPSATTAAGKSRGRPKKSAKNTKNAKNIHGDFNGNGNENGGPVANGKGGKTGGAKRKRGGNGNADVEEDGEGWVKKVKTEEREGDGEEEGKGALEMGFVVEEEVEEVDGAGEGEMVEA